MAVKRRCSGLRLSLDLVLEEDLVLVLGAGLVEEEDLVEEEGLVEEEDLVEEEGLVEEEDLVEGGLVEEDLKRRRRLAWEEVAACPRGRRPSLPRPGLRAPS